MNPVHYSVPIALAMLLSGCGGGSASGSAPVSTSPPASSTPVPTPTTVVNPLTGAAAPGSPTNIVRGTALAGATVTAYSVQPDGSSGAQLGPAATADINGNFTLTLSQAPLAMVRLIALGGSTVRKADNTPQTFDKLELVTPFVTTVENQFRITPLTDIAATAMSSLAKSGATLSDAFVGGMQNMLSLDEANLVLISDKSVYLNVLRGSIKSDTVYYGAQSEDGQELMTGLDYFGLMFDLPTKDVVRVLGMAAQGNYAPGDVDGSGKAISAGSWVNGKFDSNAQVTLKQLRESKTPDSEKTGPASGPKSLVRLNTYISRYMVMDFILDSACHGSGTSYLLTRYPFYQLTAQGTVSAAECSAVAARLSEFAARLATNNSTKTR